LGLRSEIRPCGEARQFPGWRIPHLTIIALDLKRRQLGIGAHIIAIMAEPQTLLPYQPASSGLICYIYQAWRPSHLHAWRVYAPQPNVVQRLAMTASKVRYLQGARLNQDSPKERSYTTWRHVGLHGMVPGLQLPNPSPVRHPVVFRVEVALPQVWLWRRPPVPPAHIWQEKRSKPASRGTGCSGWLPALHEG